MAIEYPRPPRTFGDTKCTKDSRRALRTVATEILDSYTRVAICICNKTAVSCLRILDRKHGKQ